MTVENDSELVDSNYLENFEEELIRADLGPAMACDFTEYIQKQLKDKQITKAELKLIFKNFLLNPFEELKQKDTDAFKLELDPKLLNIILVVGVNGVGKTTSIGKLAYKFKNQGYQVMIAAGDTFRAAAEEQLNIWSKRAAVDIVQLEEGAKSSTVVFKAIEKAKADNANVLIIDTAGRLQNKQNLMEELKKIKQVIEKNTDPEKVKLETMLVLDASTGQNALSQAEKFTEVVQLDSLILTKFDGSSKAGVVFSLAYNFKLPVKFIGIGEGLEDIKEFNLDEFFDKYIL